MASIRFTDQDRDDRGFVKAPEPRSLADLLPTPASIQADAQRPAQRPMSRSLIATQIGLGLLLIVLLAYLYLSGDRAPAAAPRAPAAAPATAQIGGGGTLKPSPIPAAAPAIAGRLLIAFAAPDGQPLGAIESTRAITPTAHYGDSWIQANVAGSGLVWLRAADSPDLAITGPDLAPRPTARPAPAQVAPVAPAATDPPPPCAQAGIAGKMVEVCGYADLAVLQEQAKAKWIDQYGGNVGIVTTPTPQEWNR